ncbi:MAG: 30S ribosomal protein S7 [SAR324 cluster bacterium]|nr:30S ribosomal protein S7 [SAR324 cluster bacterium]
MSRRRAAEKREILPDPKFNDYVVSKFVNTLMISGKKGVAEKILYGALDIISKKETETPALDVFKHAIENVRPILEVKSRRVGGSTYQVPVEVRSVRSQSLAMRWIINYAVARNGKSMQSKLAEELLDAFRGKGASVKKREDVHKMADANKAFAHYRW